MVDDDIDVRRFAIKYDPPTLVVEYRTQKGLYLKKIRIKKSATNVNIDLLVTKLIEKNSEILDESKVNREQIRDLLELLLSASTQHESELNFQYSTPAPDKLDLEKIDLNKVDDNLLMVAKKKMDLKFEANRLRPQDSGFQWDRRIDFNSTEESCEWDEEEVDDENGE